MIEPAVRSVLLADADVALAVADRVWFALRPQGERRAGVVIARQNGSDPGNLDGPAGYVVGTLQLDCLAPTYKDAKLLAAKVTSAIDGYTGTIGGTQIDWLTVADHSDVPVMPPEGKSTPQTFGVSLTVDFQHQ